MSDRAGVCAIGTRNPMPVISSDVSAMLVELYRGCREQSIDRYCGWALGLVRALVPFDSAMWGHGLADPVAIHDVHVVDQPPEMLSNYAHYQKHDFYAAAVGGQPGRTVDLYATISRADMLRHRIYLGHAKKFGMEHAICTVIPDAQSGLVNFMSLWRADYGNPFSEEQRALKEFLMPHLVETRSLNTFHHMRLRLDVSARNPYAAAACDLLGTLHEVEDAFVSSLREEWSGWVGPNLPGSLRLAVSRNDKGSYTGGSWQYAWEPMDSRVFVRARRLHAVDRLSPREREVAQLISEGDTCKDVAKVLGLAPNTVRTHLYALYRKLGVSNKAQMTRILMDGSEEPGA